MNNIIQAYNNTPLFLHSDLQYCKKCVIQYATKFSLTLIYINRNPQ